MTTRSTSERFETVENGMEIMSAEMEILKNDQHGKFTHLEALITSLFDKVDALSDGPTTPPPATFTSSDSPPAPPRDPAPAEQQPAAAAPPLQRVKILPFQGENSVDWLSRVDQYFLIHPATETEKIYITLMAMEGAALHWIQWLLHRKPNVSWSDFTTELLVRFDDNYLFDPFETLLETSHLGSVDEFVNRFVARMEHVTRLTDDYFRSIFLRGLQPDIKLWISRNETPDLFTAMQSARVIELCRQALQQIQPAQLPPCAPHVNVSAVVPKSNGLPVPSRLPAPTATHSTSDHGRS
ncbi:hypothetical protein C2S52_019666 [Perilla frutescens var. hirtella]|nr:hypothetical protein C2S52_019666 [Perilla frutescens var. hirtella]